nr:type II toxin-antitoxin system RelE/ParE family toxin [uncultured Paludibaculum sp.]
MLSDEEYRRFQAALAVNPSMGPLIRGGGGIRKVRVAMQKRGKRGGARVIYYLAVRKNLILLLYAYPKNVAETLTTKQTEELARAVKGEFGYES